MGLAGFNYGGPVYGMSSTVLEYNAPTQFQQVVAKQMLFWYDCNNVGLWGTSVVPATFLCSALIRF